MTTIDPTSDCLTLINVFTVAAENQTKLATLLVNATQETMQHLPGFISATIHRSVDGMKVTNYAQWRGHSDFEAMQKNPQAVEHMKAATALAQRVEPSVYVVIESVSRPLH